jgi:BirA family biotin operon repressor/biotin-[acetyl-CoA-carboxylase] ligase
MKEIYIKIVDSTNLYLKNNPQKEDTIVYTFNQTSGRGRENRSWVSLEDKNLALSVLLHPKNIVSPIWLIASLSLSLTKILKKYKIKDYWIKWPNDIYIKDKKLAGVLAESEWQNGKISRVIIGIGININNNETDIERIEKKATSIFIELKKNKNIELNKFTKDYIKNVKMYLKILDSKNGVEKIKRDYFLESNVINKKATWQNGIDIINGKVVNITEDGIVIFEKDNGELIEIISGDLIIELIEF